MRRSISKEGLLQRSGNRQRGKRPDSQRSYHGILKQKVQNTNNSSSSKRPKNQKTEKRADEPNRGSNADLEGFSDKVIMADSANNYQLDSPFCSIMSLKKGGANLKH